MFCQCHLISKNFNFLTHNFYSSNCSSHKEFCFYRRAHEYWYQEHSTVHLHQIWWTKEMNCRKQIFWLWTKRTSAQKLLYKFLQQNLTSSHNQFKYEYSNHLNSQDLCCVSEWWSEVVKYFHHQDLYILWIKKQIILKLSYFSKFSVKK